MATVASLDEFIEKTNLECLNQDEAHPVEHALEANKDTFLSSDPGTDPELIMKVKFRSPVKLSSIAVHGSSEDETAPKLVKIFVNAENIGFDEAQENEPTQVLTLTPNDVDVGEKNALRFVKFQNVNSLQLFFAENFGSDVTKVRQVEFFGQPASSLDMKDWKPIKG
eukprot:TRINITY_DN23237_c0_g2_i1.p1 TRINITY_DN23237_c0_g2~~TRINITY_DN23237_c0_g2_i1.p1  ORF type:complete len:185 (+),score=47.89 TRINITY_DN23237_c0_g2_i1:55-555(+)